MPRLGFSRDDFRIFEIEGFSVRMQQIAEHLQPRLTRLGNELAPELARKLHMEFFPHVAKHLRRSVNPPHETWAAWGPSPRGYKRYAYLALCVSSAGLHARVIVKSEADARPEMARRLRAKSSEFERGFRGTRVADYQTWDFVRQPRPEPVNVEMLEAVADSLDKKTGGIDLGFGWPIGESLRLDHAELLDAYAELEPLYRVLRSVV